MQHTFICYHRYLYRWSYVKDSPVPRLDPVPPSAAADLVPKKPGKSSYDRVETHPGENNFPRPCRLGAAALQLPAVGAVGGLIGVGGVSAWATSGAVLRDATAHPHNGTKAAR
jgi:hypothetical protein